MPVTLGEKHGQQRRHICHNSEACQLKKCDHLMCPQAMRVVEVCGVGGAAARIRPCCSEGKQMTTTSQL